MACSSFVVINNLEEATERLKEFFELQKIKDAEVSVLHERKEDGYFSFKMIWPFSAVFNVYTNGWVTEPDHAMEQYFYECIYNKAV